MAVELRELVCLQENFRFFTVVIRKLRMCHTDKRREESRTTPSRGTELTPWLTERECSRKRRFRTSEGKGWQGACSGTWPHGLLPTRPVLKILSQSAASHMCVGPAWLRLFVFRSSVAGYGAESQSRFASVTHEEGVLHSNCTNIMLKYFSLFWSQASLFHDKITAI